LKFDIIIGEIILIKLAKGLDFCQFESVSGTQIVCSYNKKSIRVKNSNIVLPTGLVPKSDQELQTFKNDCQALVEEIDLETIWEVVENENQSFTLNEITNIYFPTSGDSKYNTAMAIALDKDKYYFKFSNYKYLPNKSAQVETFKDFHQKSTENEKAIISLLSAMFKNILPEKLETSQQAFLHHLKQYAIYGEDYKNKQIIKPFFSKLKLDKSIQQTIFNLLVSTNIFNINEPVELYKIGEINSPNTSWISEIDCKTSNLSTSDRLNLKEADIITIDDKDTKERDDGFSIKKTDKGFEFGIHISDTSTLIKPDSILDKSARNNGSSIYLPEKTIPMLPSQFITDFGSLDPSKTRLGLSLLINTDLNYGIESWRIVPSIISAKKSMTYEQANLALNQIENSDHYTILHLWNFSKKQMCLRKQNGAVNFQTQEINIKVTLEAKIEVTLLNTRLDSRMLVSEMMILFNSLAAKFFVENNIPAIYRHQSYPNLNDYSNTDFQQVSENEISKNYYLIRNLPPTKLTGEPLPHYSLGLPSYIQITSPLRRYTDMLLQRQIIHFITYGKFLYCKDVLEHLAFGTYSRVKDIKVVERQRQKYWLIKYLENAINNRDSSTRYLSYSAIVIEKSNYGTKSLVQIIQLGFRQRINLPSYCEIGDEITLNLMGVDTWHRTAKFQVNTG
jgi:exoribonuclease-2